MKINFPPTGRSRLLPYKMLWLLLIFLDGVFPLNAQNLYAYKGISNAGIFVQQQLPQQRINLKVKNEKLQSVLQRLEKQVSYVFVYSDNDIDASQRISLGVKNAEIEEVMNIIIKQVSAEFEIINDKIIIRNKTTSDKPSGGSGSKIIHHSPGTENTVYDNDATITGRVTDDQGKGIAGASVVLSGTSTGTTTNNDGDFSLVIPDDKSMGILVISIVGYTSKEVPLEGRRQLTVTLLQSQNTMEDVVVIGYGTQRRASVTGAVDKISSAAINGRPVTNVTTALQGTSPNLIIQQNNFEPGQPVNLNIRGLGTLGDNTPLVVIDGIIGGDINLLNPADIESVSVLKDAGSAAIYGSRSANGVILITTKKGRKNERPSVSYSGIYGMQSPRITYKPVHAWENAYFKNESLVNSGLAPAFTPEEIRDFQTRGDGDWRADNLFHDAAQQTHSLSISGGSATSTYNISLGYLNQQSNFIGPGYGYKRYNIRINQSNEIGRLKVNTILSYVKVNNKDHAFGSGTLVVDAGRVPLYYSFQDSAGNYLTNPVSAQFNPKAILEKGGYRRSNDDEIFGNLNAELAVTKDFKIRGVAGGTVRSNTGFGRSVQLDFLPGGRWGDDRATTDNNFKSLFTNIQLMGEWAKVIKAHDVRVLVGGSNESFKSEGFQLQKTLTDSTLGVPVTSTIISPSASFNSINNTQETSINSLFGRASYNFSSRYFAEVNFRYDGSSKFAEGNRWGFFPSAAVAWRISEENFFTSAKRYFSDLKLRASYGILGNQNVVAYQYQTSFFNYTNAYGFNNSAVSGAGYTLGNPDLTWEKAATFNIGVDASLLNRRLDLSFDYFNKTTSDILYKRSDVPQIFGAGFPDYNVAKVRNRGWEFRATYSHAGKIFAHTFNVNLADNLNELLELTSGALEEVYKKEELELVRRVGQPITVYQGYKRDGYFQNIDDINGGPKFTNGTVTAGDIRFVDRNGDKVIDDNDKFILGNPFPRYTFGFTYTVAAKGFDVVVFLQGVGKRDQALRGEQVEPFHVGYGGTMYTHQTDYWTPTNPNAKWPRLAENGSASNANNYKPGSDLFLFDASYARLKNVQVGYTIPSRISSKAGMRTARIYLTGQNLFTLSRLTFFDPEITEFNNNTNPNTGSNSARAYFLPVFVGAGIDITF